MRKLVLLLLVVFLEEVGVAHEVALDPLIHGPVKADHVLARDPHNLTVRD